MAITPHKATLAHLRLEANRVREIIGVLAKYRLAGWLRTIPLPWQHGHEDGPTSHEIGQLSREVRIRLALTELGTTYIKLGQMMSTRPDLVGDDLAEELTQLQSCTPPDPDKVVAETIRQQLGKQPNEIFAEFEAKSFASASIAQVHKASLHTGERVAVKVQKRGIRSQIEQDLSIMVTVADLVEKHSPDLRVYNPVALVEEFRRSLMHELDFTRERRNLETFARNFEGDPKVRFPQVWPEFSTPLVLTMEFLDGILGTDLPALKASGADLEELSRRGATVYLDMIFRDSFYHADPHPGNLMCLPDSVVGIIDCGMVGRLDENLHEDFESLMLSIAQRDPEVLANTLWKLSQERPSSGRGQLQADLSVLLEESTQVSLEQVDMAEVIRGLTGMIRKYKISLRPALTQLLRTLMLLQGTSQRLDPRFSLTQVIDPYCERLILQRFSPSRIIRRLGRSYRDWDRLFQSLPRDLSEALSQLDSGTLKLRVDTRHLDGVVNRLSMAIVFAALLLGSSLLWSFKAPPLIDNISLLGVAGYVAALFVGWQLLRAILRSGNLTPKE